MPPSRIENAEVDIRELKERAVRILPPNNPLRELILGEEDFLPRGEYLIKAESWARLIRVQQAEFTWMEAVRHGEERLAVDIESHRLNAAGGARSSGRRTSSSEDGQ